jgi:hypothetical protein
MEQNDLKSMWQSERPVAKKNDALLSMMQEKNHPVLKSIRKQLIIEIVLFSVLLFVYYDFFDGDRKPLYANILLVAALMLILLHNIFGYAMTRNKINGINLLQALNSQLDKMKTYAFVSVISRMLWSICFLLFFTSTIIFNERKYWMLAILTGVVVIQVIIHAVIWTKRIRRLKSTVDGFNA